MRQRGFITLTMGLLIVIGLLTAGLGLVAKGYAKRGEQIEALEAERDGWKEVAATQAESIASLDAANRSNLTNVHDLATRLSEAIGKNQDTEAALAKARQEAANAKRAATQALDNLRKSRETLYAQDDDCRAWAAQPVCRAVSDSLRQQWSQVGTGDRIPVGFGRAGQTPTGADRPGAH
jgi:hypothetical protein